MRSVSGRALYGLVSSSQWRCVEPLFGSTWHEKCLPLFGRSRLSSGIDGQEACFACKDVSIRVVERWGGQEPTIELERNGAFYGTGWRGAVLFVRLLPECPCSLDGRRCVAIRCGGDNVIADPA